VWWLYLHVGISIQDDEYGLMDEDLFPRRCIFSMRQEIAVTLQNITSHWTTVAPNRHGWEEPPFPRHRNNHSHHASLPPAGSQVQRKVVFWGVEGTWTVFLRKQGRKMYIWHSK
jgi:hypothetical protein